MKKVFFAMALLVASIMTASAVDLTARVKISMGSSSVTIRESAEYSAARENTVDIPSYNDYGIFVNEALEGFNHWAQWGSNDISNLNLEIVQTSAADATLTFAYVIGDIKLNIDGTDVDIVDGGSAVLQAADFVDDGTGKFVYSKSLQIKKTTAPVLPKAAIEGSMLTITGYAGKLAKVEDKDGNVIVAEAALASDNEPISLAGQPAGRYVLTLDGQPYQFDIRIPEIPEANYHVVVTPAP